MYTPQPPLFGAHERCVIHTHLYPRDEGYVDLIMVVTPHMGMEVLERSTYARLTLAEAIDVIHAQASLVSVAESPS